MKTKKSVLNVLCVLVLFGSSSLYATKEKRAYSNTRQASALLRIQVDPSFVRIEDEIALYSIFRPAILQAVSNVYRDVDTKDEEMSENLVTVEFLGSLDGSDHKSVLQAAINVDLNSFNEEIPFAAEELKEETLDRLKNSLNIAYEQYREFCQNREKTYARQAEEAEAKLNAVQSDLLDISGGKKMSREFLEDRITQLSNQKQETDFHIRTTDNRIQQLDEAGAVRRDKQTNDPITNEMKKKIDLLEQSLQNTKKQAEAGRVPAQDIQDVEQRLIEARIALAERQEAANESPEAQRVRDLKEQLANLFLGRSEQDMRVRFLDEQLAEIRQRLDRSSEYETLEIKTDVQRNALHDAIEQLEAIRRDDSLLSPPVVTVISQ